MHAKGEHRVAVTAGKYCWTPHLSTACQNWDHTHVNVKHLPAPRPERCSSGGRPHIFPTLPTLPRGKERANLASVEANNPFQSSATLCLGSGRTPPLRLLNIARPPLHPHVIFYTALNLPSHMSHVT